MKLCAAVQGPGILVIPSAGEGGSVGCRGMGSSSLSGVDRVPERRGGGCGGTRGGRQQCWQLERLPERSTGFCSTLSYLPVPFCALTTWL